MANALTQLRKKPAQKRATVTFDAILDAATQILEDKGARALTTNRIAVRAGVSVGSLYQYFPNKEAIVRALIERELARSEASRPAILDDEHASRRQVMSAAVDWHFDAYGMDLSAAAALRKLARSLLPLEEQDRVANLRQQRLARTVGRLTRAQPTRSAHATLLVDVCLDAICKETLRRHPEWLASETFRKEVSTLLSRYLSPLSAA